LPLRYNLNIRSMDEMLATINKYETQIYQIGEELKRSGRISEALSSLQEIERQLEQMDILPVGEPYRERERVMAICLNRQADELRNLIRFKEAGDVSERELIRARQSGHLITLANALLSDGNSKLMNNDFINGEHAIEEAQRLFESGDTRAHIHGLGRYWLFRAKVILDGELRHPTSEALTAADNAVNSFLRIDDCSYSSKAILLRAKAQRLLGETELAALDIQKAQRLKSKRIKD
jgi:tetratricopeptide (TPR) repeat protein